MAHPGEGPGGPRPPLIFRLKWGPKGRKTFFWDRPPPPLISESGWRPPSHLSEGLDPPLPRGSSDRSEMVSNGQKAGRKRVKVREYFSSFPFFLDHTWDTPTALRLTIDLATFSLIPREFETGKRNFACEYSHLSSLLAKRVAKGLLWWGARRDGFTRRLKGSWHVLFR